MIVFDLDDTLFPEIEYVHSAYRAIARLYGDNLLPIMNVAPNPAKAFEAVLTHRPDVTIEDILKIYRTHRPDITLPWQSLYTLAYLHNTGHTLGIITDGRSITQRHKIEALRLDRFIAPDLMIISQEIGADKTTAVPFTTMMQRHHDDTYIYIGDNPAKDFINPEKLGWQTVCLLDNGHNIHPQNLFQLPSSTFTIKSLTDLIDITIKI